MICQKMSRRGPTPNAQVHQRIITGTPIQRISLDLIGHPNKIKTVYRYVLHVVDFASRWPEVVAIKSIATECICEALMSLFARFRYPESILSGNRPQIGSRMTDEVKVMLDFKHRFCSFHHATANGLFGKLNAVLKQLLAKVSCDHLDEWDKYLNQHFVYHERNKR